MIARIAAALVLWVSLACSAGESRPFVADSLGAIKRELAGRSFVLALWSVSCEPCRRELGRWGEWQRRFPGVPIVLVSTDPVEDRAAAQEFLDRQDLGRVQTWMFDDEYVERLRYAVDPRWRGELPRAYFFDAAHRAEVRSGLLDQQWAEAWLVRAATGASGLQGRAKP